MTSKRDSRCFVLALAPDAPATTRLPCLAYINVPLSTYCKIRYVSKFTVASRGSPCDSTAFLLADRTAHTIMICKWHYNVVGPSVTLCTVAKQYIQVQQKCLEQANRKCPPRNTSEQLSTPYADPGPSSYPPPTFHVNSANYL